MKKLLLSLVVLTALVAFGAAQAEAADITVTVTVASTIAISVDPTSWPVGDNLTTGESRDTTATGITVSNNGTSSATLTIGSGTSDPSGWTLGAVAGDDVYVMEWSLEGASPWNWVAIATSEALGTLAGNANERLDLQFTAPSATDDGGTGQTITVSVTGA